MAKLVEGQAIIVDIEFRVGGRLVDPDTTQVLVKPPLGDVRTFVYPSAQVQRLDIGQFEFSTVVDQPGTWGFRAVGSGPGGVNAVYEIVENVADSRVI